MGTHARIENGFISIDTRAWLDQRTGGPLDDLTYDLHAWVVQEHLGVTVAAVANIAGSWPLQLGRYGWQKATLGWFTARGHAASRLGEGSEDDARPTVISHELTRLDRDLWLARGVTAAGTPLVVVQLEDE